MAVWPTENCFLSVYWRLTMIFIRQFLYDCAMIGVPRQFRVSIIRRVYCQRTQSTTFATNACWVKFACAALQLMLWCYVRRSAHLSPGEMHLQLVSMCNWIGTNSKQSKNIWTFFEQNYVPAISCKVAWDMCGLWMSLDISLVINIMIIIDLLSSSAWFFINTILLSLIVIFIGNYHYYLSFWANLRLFDFDSFPSGPRLFNFNFVK